MRILDISVFKVSSLIPWASQLAVGRAYHVTTDFIIFDSPYGQKILTFMIFLFQLNNTDYLKVDDWITLHSNPRIPQLVEVRPNT